MATQYVVFSLSGQQYGIEIFKIKEVFSYRKITPLPHVKGFVKGIINLRGVILPVFDLRDKFDLPLEQYTPFHVIIVVEIAGRVMGIIADEISDVLELQAVDFQTTGNLPPGISREYLKGVGRKGEEMTILLDVDKLLSTEELEMVDAT
ncbi:MAG: chemotaxis protein CheW [Desulfatibacillaceae bacterium]